MPEFLKALNLLLNAAKALLFGPDPDIPTYSSEDPIRTIEEHIAFRRARLGEQARRMGFVKQAASVAILVAVYLAIIVASTATMEPANLSWLPSWLQATPAPWLRWMPLWLWWVLIVLLVIAAFAIWWVVSRGMRRVSDGIAREFFELAATEASIKELRQYADQAERHARMVTALKEISLGERLAGLRRRIELARKLYLGSFAAALLIGLFIIVAIIPYLLVYDLPAKYAAVTGHGDILVAIQAGATFLVSLVVPPAVVVLVLIWAFWCRALVNTLRLDAQQAELEIDLNRFTPNEAEKRAERLLRVNQVELRRYYDINVDQNRQVYRVGVLLIIFGVALSVLTIFKIGGEATDAAGLVAAGVAILSNFVAAMFIRMHSNAAIALTRFHGRLVDTDRLYLAHVIASRLTDPLRSQTLAALSLAIANQKPDVKSGDDAAGEDKKDDRKKSDAAGGAAEG